MWASEMRDYFKSRVCWIELPLTSIRAKVSQIYSAIIEKAEDVGGNPGIAHQIQKAFSTWSIAMLFPQTQSWKPVHHPTYHHKITLQSKYNPKQPPQPGAVGLGDFARDSTMPFNCHLLVLGTSNYFIAKIDDVLHFFEVTLVPGHPGVISQGHKAYLDACHPAVGLASLNPAKATVARKVIYQPLAE